MRATRNADGTLANVGYGEPRAGEIALDDVAPHAPGDRLILDPQDPRRAIPAPPPVPTYAELRAREYPSTEALVVALWEREVEGRPEAAERLQEQRSAVKAKYPKPKE